MEMSEKKSSTENENDPNATPTCPPPEYDQAMKNAAPYAQPSAGAFHEAQPFPAQPSPAMGYPAAPYAQPSAGAFHGAQPFPAQPSPAMGYPVAPYAQPSMGAQPFQPAGYQAPSLPDYAWLVGQPGSPGLCLLDDLDEVIVERLIDPNHLMMARDGNALERQFRVSNKNDQQLYFLSEAGMITTRMQRAYDVTAKDSFGQDVFNVNRIAEECPCGFCCACLPSMQSKAAINILGPTPTTFALEQRCSFLSASFVLMDTSSHDIMTIKGLEACCTAANTYEFQMTSGDRSRGRFDKMNIRALVDNSLHRFSLKFPANVSSYIKACCIATVVHFDFRFFMVPINNPNRYPRGRRY